MMEQQLYVDGELMDITDDMSITLDIKSNLFRDVTKITSNNTYTVNLPKTAHNMKVLEHSDKPKSSSKFPYTFHVCRYLRNGVEIIKDGRLTLMSVADSIEVAIYWGIFPAFDTLKEDNKNLSELGISNRMKFDKYNKPYTKAEALTYGMFYAYYNPYIIESDTSNFGANFVQGGESGRIKYYQFGSGKIKTGTDINAYIGGEVQTDSDMLTVLAPFLPSMRTTFTAAGQGDYASYAVLDKNYYIISLGDNDGKLKSYTIEAPSNSAFIVVNVKKELYYNEPLGVYGQYDMRETFDPWNNEEDFVGDDIAANSEYKTTPKYLQPCVLVSWLLDKIKHKTGVEFVWSGDANDLISSLVVPIINNKADSLSVTGSMTATLNSTSSLGDLSFSLSNKIDAVTTKDGTNVSKIEIKTDCTLAFDVQLKYYLTIAKGENWLECPIYLVAKVESYEDGKTSETTYNIGLATYDDGDVRFESIKSSDNVNGKVYRLVTGLRVLELKANDKVSFSITRAGIESTPFNLYAGTISATVNNGDSVPFGGSFPIGINLPEINVLDFVRFLSLVTGSFPRQLNDTGKVEFVEYSSVWGNRSKAVNWSSRLIALEARNTPRNTDFSYSDYKQVNHYKWKEDEQTHTENDADIVINNKTLDYEQDVWTLPFAATDGNRIPIRSSDAIGEKDGGEYKACKDRIMTLREDKEQAALTFGIDLQNIFATKYVKLAKSLSKAHVITEYLYLSDIEILNFDETVPIYLAQYGAYFAVLELKVTDNGYTEATMIQLEF